MSVPAVTPLKPTTPGPAVADRPRPEKMVLLACTNGRWEATISLVDPKNPVTERDLNQLTTLLRVKRADFRIKAYQAYSMAQREQNEKNAQLKTAVKTPV